MEKAEYLNLDAVARSLGISRERAENLTKRADFPRHICQLTVGKLWRSDEVEAWAYRARRK